MEANVQTYSVYTIFTESDSIDFENTIRALLATDKIPLSLFIIGLGDIKYTNLQKVFSDNGLYGRCVFPRSWENVKFVRYSDYEDVFDIENLLLSFLPEQVLEYMKNNNISPLVRKRKNSTHVTNPASPNNTISRNSVSTNPSNTFNLKVVTEDQAMRRNSTISHQRRASVVAKSLQTATAASLPTVAGSHKQQSRNVSSPEEKIESNRRPSRNFGSERNSCIIDNSLSPCTPRKSFTAAISHRNSLIHQNYLDGVLLKLSTESLLKDNELCEKQEKRPTAVESASSIEDKTTYSSETVGKHVENLELKFDKFEENVQNDLSIILDLVRGLGASLVRIENRISQLENQAGQRYLEK
ncbi:hypothetical protein HK099_006350 [Clydaea vesicula]|uniref:Copine C-terminal domain-containing protein n=1 Tax=Clydaea vesicula TaxID=447962 RepID=A0AAD5U9R4_9FUNG|nr:hypothetical protein HK099_006350 [Clydaea vesicula]